MEKAKILRLNENGETKLYVPYKDYKELNKNYTELLAQNEVKKEIKLHDIVKYKNHEWYVIKIKEKLVTLMTKDIISSVTYSSDNSNDWEKSNVRDLLDSWLLDSDSIIGELVEMKTNYDEDKYSSDLIRIPTLREIESLSMDIRNCGESYWTMTSSYGVSEDCSYAYVFNVNSNGNLGSNNVNDTDGVRPVITLKTDKLN